MSIYADGQSAECSTWNTDAVGQTEPVIGTPRDARVSYLCGAALRCGFMGSCLGRCRPWPPYSRCAWNCAWPSSFARLGRRLVAVPRGTAQRLGGIPRRLRFWPIALPLSGPDANKSPGRH